MECKIGLTVLFSHSGRYLESDIYSVLKRLRYIIKLTNFIQNEQANLITESQ